MEPLFENKYTRDKEGMGEILKYFYFKKPILIVLDILLAPIFIFAIISFFYPPIFPYNDWRLLYFVVPLFSWTVGVMRYFKAVKLNDMRDREINNGKPLDVIYTVSDEKVEDCCESIETKNSVTLFQIKKVVKTKNFIILITVAKLSFIFKKDSFTKGTPEGLLEFLKSKGLNS